MTQIWTVACGQVASMASGRPLRPSQQTINTLVFLFFGVVAIGIGTDSVITLSPSLAARFRGGPREIGLLTSAFGVGSLLSLVAIPLMRKRLRAHDTGATRLAVLALGIAGARLSPTLPLATATLGIAGMGMTRPHQPEHQIQQRTPMPFEGE